MPIKEFSIVDILTYFIPGAAFLFGLYIGGIFEPLETLFNLNNETLIISLLVISSYIIGHIIHYPAVLFGRIIVKLVGAPQIYLLDVNSNKVLFLKDKLRSDFSREYKIELNKALQSFWHREPADYDCTKVCGYYDRCEVLVEEYHPRAWAIHERFYTSANLTRALIIPVASIAIVIWNDAIILSIFSLIGCLILGYRYYVLTVSAVKQIYNMFFLHYLKNCK